VIPAFLNVGAGGADDVQTVLREAGAFEIIEVPAGRMTQAVRAAVDNGARRVAAVGGDGTVSAVAAGVVRTETELAVIPAGTLNHFARDHGIPRNVREACAVAQAGRVIRADVAWVNDRLFLSTSAVGVYANFVRVRDNIEPRFGYWLSSLFAMVRTFVRVQPFRVTFETGPLQRDYITPQVFIGLGERELKLPKLGGRVESGKPGLHVMIVRGRTRARLVTLAFAAAARGTHAISSSPHLDGFLVRRCSIEQRHSTVAVDGEVVTLKSPLEYEFGEDALKLVVPA
jgi:diacylglycerol kinase family enzyme